jgi:hypothetical protein
MAEESFNKSLLYLATKLHLRSLRLLPVFPENSAIHGLIPAGLRFRESKVSG